MRKNLPDIALQLPRYYLPQLFRNSLANTYIDKFKEVEDVAAKRVLRDKEIYGPRRARTRTNNIIYCSREWHVVRQYDPRTRWSGYRREVNGVVVGPFDGESVRVDSGSSRRTVVVSHLWSRVCTNAPQP